MNKLTERDLEVLAELEAACRSNARLGMHWQRPLDCGGSNGSDHSYRLTRLAKMGFADQKQRGWPDPVPGEPAKKLARGYRGSKAYRINDAGRRALSASQKGEGNG